MYDCAIIGTGAAGVSAALTLKALNKNILWLGSKKLSAKINGAEKIKNYPGLSSVSGQELQEAFRAQIEETGLQITEGTVTGVYDLGGRFGVLCGQDSYEAKTVVLTTGVESVKPIAGELEYVGKGVSYCAVCDGFLYRNKTIAVLCMSKEAEHEVEFLATLAAKVYLVALYKGVEIKADNVQTVSGAPVAVTGGARAEKLVFKDKEIAVDGVFFLKNAVAPNVLVPNLQTDGGHVVVNRACETNIAGLFAAGDCTGRPYQYAKAVGEGNVAAHSVNAYLAKR